MALKREKKESIVDEVSQALASSKMTVVAAYKGTPVKQMQLLRQSASETKTSVKVIKNRLVIKALKNSDTFKNVDPSLLSGMLLYAFNSEDELASAQSIANFAKTQPTVQIIGALTDAGEFISADDTKALAALPSKEQLRGQLVGILAAPLSGFVNVLSGNVRGVLQVLNARSQSIS